MFESKTTVVGKSLQFHVFFWSNLYRGYLVLMATFLKLFEFLKFMQVWSFKAFIFFSMVLRIFGWTVFYAITMMFLY